MVITRIRTLADKCKHLPTILTQLYGNESGKQAWNNDRVKERPANLMEYSTSDKKNQGKF